MRKLTKTLLFVAVVTTMMLALALTASATNSNRVVDNEGILLTYQEETLEERFEEISGKYSCDIVFVTSRNFSGYDSGSYAENYYDSHSYGYGTENSGIILVVSKTQREYYILLTGKGDKALNNTQFRRLKDTVEEFFGDDDFYGGALAFATDCETALSSYDENGGKTGFDIDTFITGAAISLVVAVIAALITVLVMKSKMNNAKPQKNATRYVKENSFNLTLSRDSYLYSTVKKIPRPKNNSSSSSGRSGGSRRGGGGRF